MSVRIVILIVVVAFVVFRLWTRARGGGAAGLGMRLLLAPRLRGRGRGGAAGGAGVGDGGAGVPDSGAGRGHGGPAAPWLALPRSLGAAGLVAEREISVRLRGRIFRLGTAFVVLASVAAVVLPTLGSGATKPQRVGVVGAVSAPLRTAVSRSGRSAGAPVRLVAEASDAAGRTALRAGQIDVLIERGAGSVLVQHPLASDSTSQTARTARAIASTLGVDQALAAAGLTPAQASLLAHARPLPLRSLERGRGNTARVTSFVGLELLLFMFITYNSWILYGVMEEKSSRIVEVLLATLRPIQLLAGKVLGIGLLAIAQAALVVAAALIAAKLSGSHVAQGSTPLFLVSCFVWLLLGYAFYCWVYAAAGSMAERREQVMTLIVPLSLPIVFGYIVALTAAGTGSANLLVRVLAYVPPTAPFAMPALVSLNAVSWWEFALSIVISLACTVVMARLAAGLYQRAILRTGGRVRLRELLAAE